MTAQHVESPPPRDPDIHLRFSDITDPDRPIVLADYRISRTAAHELLRDWTRHHSPNLAIEFCHDSCANLSRMTTESLYR